LHKFDKLKTCSPPHPPCGHLLLQREEKDFIKDEFDFDVPTCMPPSPPREERDGVRR